MKKTLVTLLLLMIIWSCTKDDFCTQSPVTPNLILRFYDDINRGDLKSTSGLFIWADNKDTIFINQATDSLVIPLNTASNQTIYNLSEGNVVNQFTINYTIRNEFVSRSCGFKSIYENVTFSSSSTWITDFTPTTLTSIENQNSAHVQIFH